MAGRPVSETCLKCAKSYDGRDAEQVVRGNGVCVPCGGRREVELHAVICADTRIHDADDPDHRAVYTTRAEAEGLRDAMNGRSFPCGPHRAVTLKSNRVRVLASNLDHAHSGVRR